MFYDRKVDRFIKPGGRNKEIGSWLISINCTRHCFSSIIQPADVVLCAVITDCFWFIYLETPFSLSGSICLDGGAFRVQPIEEHGDAG